MVSPNEGGASPSARNPAPSPAAPAVTNARRRAGESRYAAATHPTPIETPSAAIRSDVSSSVTPRNAE